MKKQSVHSHTITSAAAMSTSYMLTFLAFWPQAGERNFKQLAAPFVGEGNSGALSVCAGLYLLGNINVCSNSKSHPSKVGAVCYFSLDRPQRDSDVDVPQSSAASAPKMSKFKSKFSSFSLILGGACEKSSTIKGNRHVIVLSKAYRFNVFLKFVFATRDNQHISEERIGGWGVGGWIWPDNG